MDHAPVRRSVARLALVFLGVVTAAPAGAQRETRSNFNGWLNWFGDVELSDRWAIDYDGSIRRSGPYDEVAQYLWRASLRRNLLPNVRVAVGYAGSDTHPYGDLPIAYRSPEHRLFEQLQLAHASARVQWTHRYRLEQRWLGRVDLEDGEERVQNWVRTNRMRYLARATVPLQGPTLERNEWFVTIADELFMNFGANIRQNVLDQNRLMATIGRRLGSAVRLEVGYLDHLVMRASGLQMERNHTLLTTLTTSVPRGGR